MSQQKIEQKRMSKTEKNHSEYSRIDSVLESFNFEPNLTEVGSILSITSGIARVSGLPNVGYEELLSFPYGIYGIAFNIEPEEVGVILLGDESLLKVGDSVERTGRVMDVPVGDELLGRVINPLGEALDNQSALAISSRLPIEREAPAIMDRDPVSKPLQTGIKVIDALIPIGRGQRELILGDRQTGKTTIAIDTIINQKDQNVICIYCAIGQRASSIAKSIKVLEDNKALEYTTVVVTEASAPPGLLYIAPYAATSIAEHFMSKGKDVLIVYDDLTNHARAYRELSLLMHRPPGREAFPGDVFYLHSRLLERSTCLRSEQGGGSMTALPIVETEAENISAYIPTNLISITDGQIYLSPKLFELGFLPAINIGLSVSRVGSKAQLPAYHSVAGSLKLAYSQFEELESFSRFGTHIDEESKKKLEHGKRIRACFKQGEQETVSVADQIILLLALTNNLLDDVPLNKIEFVTKKMEKIKDELDKSILSKLLSDQPLDDNAKSTVLQVAMKLISETLANSN